MSEGTPTKTQIASDQNMVETGTRNSNPYKINKLSEFQKMDTRHYRISNNIWCDILFQVKLLNETYLYTEGLT